MRKYLLVSGVCAGVLSGLSAYAATFDFTYSGYFSTADALNPAGGATEFFAATTPFTLRARFTDDDNLVEPVDFPFPTPPGFTDGFVAYSPLAAAMDIGGAIYTVASFADDPAGGIAVALFDDGNFFSPGLFGAGFLNNPVADGAGIVGDFSGAAPAFDAEAIGDTTFTGYNGAGFTSGVCAGPGVPPCAISPFSLFAPDGTPYALTLSVRIEQVVDTGLVHSASIAPVPLPAALGLLAGGLGGLGLLGFAGRRKAQA